MRHSSGVQGQGIDDGITLSRLFRAIVCALVIPASLATALHLAALDPDSIGDIARARMEADGVPGLVVIPITDGVPIWTGAFGMADPAMGLAMTADALFRVESISKPVTAWGAMRLAESGRLDLDAPLGDCLRRWHLPEEVAQITPRRLLSHSAGIGLGDFAARYPPEAPRPNLPDHIAQDFTLISVPEAGFAYSDTGFNLLELAVEDCTLEDFAALMAHEVLEPLRMVRASFDWTGAPMSVGHDLRGRPVQPYVYPGRASGGLLASAADIARFAAAAVAGAEQDVLSLDGDSPENHVLSLVIRQTLPLNTVA